MSDPGAPIQQAKLVLLGDMGAGKSSLVLRFVKGQFFDYQVGNGRKAVQHSEHQFEAVLGTCEHAAMPGLLGHWSTWVHQLSMQTPVKDCPVMKKPCIGRNLLWKDCYLTPRLHTWLQFL